MKNFKHIILCGAALSVSLGACKKSFLDEKPNDNTISTEQEAAAVAQDPSLVNGRVAGLYTSMYQDFTGSPADGDHSDFGQKGVDIVSDMLCSDMVLGGNNYGWYENIVRYISTKSNVNRDDKEPFNYYYKIVFAANTLIGVLGGNDVVPANADLRHYMGQAKAMRAYAYFYLNNLYSRNAYGAGTEKVLPLYTSISQINQPAVTNAELYTQMIKDLNDAISLMSDFTRPNKGAIDANVAKGLLAYVYAARGTNADLTNVVSLTSDVLGKYPLTTNAQAKGGFTDLATSSWIWGADITLDSGLDLVSWWGQMDIFTYSYAWAGDPKFIDDLLYSKINANDIRKTQFVDNPDYGGLLPTGKFYDLARKEGGQRNVTDDYIYMRSDEMLLLNAEAKSRLALDNDARAEIKILLDLRLGAANDAYLATLTGANLKEEIYLQSRIELWGEGKSYLSMKRNKHSITRGTNHLFLAGQTFTYDAPELTYVIPSSEILYNPNLNK